MVTALLLAGCSEGGSSAPATSQAPSHTPAVSTTTLWPTYHLDAARSGDDTGEPSFRSLARTWTTGPLDGAIYAEPLVDGTEVIVATENDSVYAFDTRSGALRWHTSLGTPRTSNFPCGDVMPLGVTGTPVIAGGRIFVAAEVEAPSGVYRFRLAALNPSTGATVFNDDVTPSGMDANTQQQRSALAVSHGNVIIAWGGLFGDCGTYHGYVEAVSEQSGAATAQWRDTPNDNEGGVWSPSGPAVDGAGNIYVTTGNGGNTAISQYDYGDSVVELSPSLAVRGFFATGPPQSWASLNATDQDLGSIGPSLLTGGLLFAMGKGGRGYLLTESALPGNSNPGGGENAGAAVCHQTSNAAYSGMAAAGATVYVPCADGIAAVRIDSAHAFHVLWYSTSGSSAPILAGGLVWSLHVFGGTELVGLDPATGVVVSSLTLPATTAHFATPAAGEGRLFVAAADLLVAFAAA